MSISIDDLVASLSANHIGQEAIDLANLQAQLAQTLCYQTAAQNGFRNPAPCTTPTSRTPGRDWPNHFNGRNRSSSVASVSARSGQLPDNLVKESAETDMDMDMDMDADDDVAVENLLDAMAQAPPSSTRPVTNRSRQPSLSGSISNSTYYLGPPNLDSCSPTHSTFATTDPFFLAAQAPQPPSNSFFAQVGRPSQHSPFLMHAAQPSHEQNRNVAFAIGIDQPLMYRTAAAMEG